MENQRVTRRKPTQDRARLKVELILEAAMQLLETGEIDSLTTNAVAARAGVSIGTLYQYFGSKQALLDELVAREVGVMSDKIVASLRAGKADSPGDRVRRIVRAVRNAYGGRNRVHRMLIEHASSGPSSSRLSPLFARLIDVWATDGVTTADNTLHRLSRTDAFVLVHAVAGVLRTAASSSDAPPAAQIEDALVRLVMGFISGRSAISRKDVVEP